MRKQAGFTLLELVIAVLAIAAVGTILWTQGKAIETSHRDSSRKVAINAIYSNLEEVVYPSLGGYPRSLVTTQLHAMDPQLLVDPSGRRITSQQSDYRYEPTSCNGTNICEHYTLRSALEREADFVRQSQH